MCVCVCVCVSIEIAYTSTYIPVTQLPGHHAGRLAHEGARKTQTLAAGGVVWRGVERGKHSGVGGGGDMHACCGHTPMPLCRRNGVCVRVCGRAGAGAEDGRLAVYSADGATVAPCSPPPGEARWCRLRPYPQLRARPLRACSVLLRGRQRVRNWVPCTRGRGLCSSSVQGRVRDICGAAHTAGAPATPPGGSKPGDSWRSGDICPRAWSRAARSERRGRHGMRREAGRKPASKACRAATPERGVPQACHVHRAYHTFILRVESYCGRGGPAPAIATRSLRDGSCFWHVPFERFEQGS